MRASHSSIDRERRLDPSEVERREGAHGKRAAPLHLDRDGGETEAGIRQRLEAAQVLDDRDARAEQDGVHGPVPVGRIVDVQGVDPHQRRAGAHQVARRRLGEERMTLEIALGAPVPAEVGRRGSEIPGALPTGISTLPGETAELFLP